MNRDQKQAVVAHIRETLEASTSVVVIHYRGLTVAQMSDLRQKAQKNNADVYVTKNTMARIAANDTKFSTVSSLFSGPTAIVFSSDEIAAAKTVVDFAKTNEILQIVGGAIGQNLLDEAGVRSLAKMPSLDQSRATLVGILQAPASKFLSILQAPAGQVARVCGAYGKKES